MKRICGLLAVLAMGMEPAMAADVKVSNLALEGKIEGENITFTITINAENVTKGALMPLVVGDVAYLDGKLPSGSELVRQDNRYVIKFGGGFFGLGSGKQDVVFTFASTATKDGDWRKTAFSIPAASVRKLSVECDRNDLEIKFPGALDVQRQKTKDGKTIVTAFLGITSSFEVAWKPEIKKFESELVASCEANTIATASVGALRLDTVLTYRIIQGELTKLAMVLPDVNITQVRGEDIQDWKIDKTDKDKPKLLVSLGRPKDSTYRLQIESEMVLPKFPCKFNLPVVGPQNVLRTSGFLLIGTDSAIKLQVSKIAGLTQVDQGSFPVVDTELRGVPKRVKPMRSTYAYQYANIPYTMEINADDIVTSFSVEDILSLSVSDNDLVFNAQIALDIKDAPAREIIIETDPDPAWTVTSITGKQVSEPDTDVREEKGKRVIYIPFKQAVSGSILVNVKMEKTLSPGATAFSVPVFKVLDAKAERGYLVIAGEKGLRLKADKVTGMREVHIGSVSVTIPGAQQAFRFKSSDWKVGIALERTIPALHSEVFHLVSLGQGVMYPSAFITYNIGGAPIQEFKVRVPADIQAVEFRGVDIEGWTREGDVCTVRLQTRITGDYTMLVTYDRQFNYDKGESVPVGVIETVGTESEMGFMAIASSASLLVETATKPDTTFEISKDEIPAAYRAFVVNDPIIKSYKYVRAPHAVVVKVKPYPTEQLLGQNADYVDLATRISKNGEAVTTAKYFIKNASKQYLILDMPDKLDPWSVTFEGQGKKEEVKPQRNKDGSILIPVPRTIDPNAPMCVEVKYAQKHGALGFWWSGVKGIKFTAPMLPETHTAFANWRVTALDNMQIAGWSGNLTPRGGLYSQNVFVGILKKVWRIFRGGVSSDCTIKSALGGGMSGRSVMDFSGALKMAGKADPSPVQIRLQIVSPWVGGWGSARVLGICVIAGLLLLLRGFKVKSGPALKALAWTFIVTGIAYSAAGRSILAVIVAAALVCLFIYLMYSGGLRFLWRCVKYVFVDLPGRLFRRMNRRSAGVRQPPNIPADEPPPFEPEAAGPGGKHGFIDTRAVVALLLAGSIAGQLAARESVSSRQQMMTQDDAPVMQMVTHTVESPSTAKDAEKSAKVTTALEFKTEKACLFMVLPVNAVLTQYDLGSRNIELIVKSNGYFLNVKGGGKYSVKLSYRVPVGENNGTWLLTLLMPENIRNKVLLKIPEVGMDVASEQAVLFKTAEKAGATEVEAVFGPAQNAALTWKPRVRKTTLEEVIFFSEVNTYAAMQSGVVEFSSQIKCQIAQGEIKELKLKIPASMSVTAVRANGLATWSFDPEKRQLDIIMERPVSGDFSATVVTQIACDGLPYNATAGAMQVVNASRQRGAIAFAAPETVQVKIEDTKGLNAMNIEDFSALYGGVGEDTQKRRETLTVRKAYRYNQAEEVSAKIIAEKVLPEIRISESGSLDISDERIKMATKIEVSIAKAGIFSTDLLIPAEFEVESLTGRDVSHWDELREGGEHGVTVFFTRQVADSTEINLVVARTEKGVEGKITVPRISVRDAAKHTGRLTVSGERGIRLMVDSQKGVDVKKASEEGIKQAGVLVFDILRPGWEIVLKTDVLQPVVKSEMLQVVSIAEGMLRCQAFIHCQIENAGVKSFKLKSPKAGISLAVTGKNITRVIETDKEKGIWQVELNTKEEKAFDMVAAYQVSYERDQSVLVKPIQMLDAEGQRGYLVVTCEGRVQVKPGDALKGLKPDDQRTIPPVFKAGDLSGAVLCYMTVSQDYELPLSVVRHDQAKVLPATIRSVNIISTISTSGKILTDVALHMTVGDLRFLKVNLPNKEDALWTVQVNGREVATSLDGKTYIVPLDEQFKDRLTRVELIYAGAPSAGRLFGAKKYEAPDFGLPLNEISWTFYGLPDVDYYWFGGTMEHRRPQAVILKEYNLETYSQLNAQQRKANLDVAKSKLDEGGKYFKKGEQAKAKQILQEALNSSQADPVMNEDARVQLRNVVKQQVKMGLVNRRDAIRFSRNIVDDQEEGRPQAPQGGNYSQESVASVESQLSEKENDALDFAADKMFDQQTAAASVVSAIRVAMPCCGKELSFYRASQIEPKDRLSVKFRESTGMMTGFLKVLSPAFILFLIFWIPAAVRAHSKKG